MSETLVMIHGLGQNRYCFEKQKELEDTFDQIISLELLGHGENKSTDEITLENMARNILKQLDELNVDKFHICGLSLGSIVAQEIIRQNRDRVKSLIITNGLSYFPYIHTSIIELFKPLSVTCPETHLETIIDNAIHIKTPEVIELAKRGFTIKPDTYEQCAKSGLYVNYTALLKGWYKPTLIIYGTHDEITNEWFARYSYISLPIYNMKKTIVELKCGHLAPIELPEQFNNEIRKFYKKYLKL